MLAHRLCLFRKVVVGCVRSFGPSIGARWNDPVRSPGVDCLMIPQNKWVALVAAGFVGIPVGSIYAWSVYIEPINSSKPGQSEWHNAGPSPALSSRLIRRFRCARNIGSHRCTGNLLRNQWSARWHRGYHPLALYLGCNPLRTRVRGWWTGSRTA